MQAVHGVTFAEGGARPLPPLDVVRLVATAPRSTRSIVHSGGGLEATAIGDGEMQRRSYPNSFRGHIKAAGWEHIRTLGLSKRRSAPAREAVELLSAPECPSEVTTLILDSGQVELQVHESIGHPIELDRVLGMEEAYAGSSFLTPEDRGTLRYGSPLVIDHGRRHAPRRARARSATTTRASPRSAYPIIGRRRLPELPLQPRDGAGHRRGAPTARCAPTAGRTCR